MLKNFVGLLLKDEEFFFILHNMILKEIYSGWIGLKRRVPTTTLMDFGKVMQAFKKNLEKTFSFKLYSNFQEFEFAFNKNFPF